MRLDDEKPEMYAIRRHLDQHPAICQVLNATERHFLAETLAIAALWEVNRRGEASRHVVFDQNGNPHCSWCGRMGCNDGNGPTMSSTHPQYGLFCTCTVPRNDDASQGQSQSAVTPS